jgi:tRNA modification GTPase
MSVFDTVAAIATPFGNSGIGIVRISGPSALGIAKKFGSKKLRPRHATLVKISFGDITDTAIVIFFPSPNSFTGENVVELQCHGGTLLLEKVLDAAISFGARLAHAGEFSRRALLNGKMPLDQAESVINIINAESDAELYAASSFLTGEFSAKMKSIEQELIKISAQIEGALDHPDEIELPDLNKEILNLIAEINSFTENIAVTNYIYNGIRVAILGMPNVGKSSLFNALLGTERSIVTQIPGTTTDTVSESMQIDGFKIRFLDTAGIHSGRNQVEKLGIARTRRAATECDIALVILDAGKKRITAREAEIIKLAENKPSIKVFNKCDLCKNEFKEQKDTLYVSALYGTNIESLKQAIIKKTVGMNTKISSRLAANVRQQNELSAAKSALEEAIHHRTADCLASAVQTALFHIGNITGTNATEAVLDKIFLRFCLGK